MSLRSSSCLGAILFAVLVAGCPSGSEVDVDSGSGDSGSVTIADGSRGPDAALPPACGRLLTRCDDGATCEGAPDCVSRICFGGTCQTGAPADGTKNGDETDIDCGGLKAPACVDGKRCVLKTDCVSGVCTGNVCQVPSSTDGVTNGDETGKDCGGAKALKCPAGQGCVSTADCAMLKCDLAQKICLPPSHTDGFKNDGETGVDCGGTATLKCALGGGCVTTADCDAAACDVGATQVCLAPTHTDGIKNLGETGSDCGGAAPLKCATGQGCAAASDCDRVLCDVGGTQLCLAPSHTDGIKNLGETGVDCGGLALPSKCATGQGCATSGDCNNVLCDGGTLLCDVPTKSDGLKNGTETDTDCGGGAPTNAVRCTDDLSCAADLDCASTFCNGAGKCVAGQSCKGTVGAATAGIVTCGKRETGDGTKVHESCCRSLPLPVTTAVRLDKYEVTSGRMRQFVESVGPNLRNWAKTAMIAGTPLGLRLKNDLVTSAGTDMSDVLPASATPGEPMNLVQQIGATVMDSRRPSMSQGCFNSSVAGAAYGANTYYWDGATLRAHFLNHADRRFTKAEYDEKSLNCGAYWMYAAFCSWDGGRMPTEAEMNEAWGATAYPWGTATFGFPVNNQHQGQYGHEVTANYFNVNNNFFYHYPDFGDGADNAGFIAAPGRFILDKTAQVSANGEHWMDLGANVMELTRFKSPASGSDTFCDFSITNAPGDVPNLAVCNDGGVAGVVRKSGLPNTVWVGGSWEGHQKFSSNTALEPWFYKNSYNLPAQTQYGKTGVRCAR